MTELTFKLRQAHQEKMERMVDEYGSILENRDKTVLLWDVSELPYPKEEILMAFLTKLHTSPSKTIAGIYEAAALTLSNYQIGVGSSPIRLPDLSRVVAANDLAAMRAATADLSRLDTFKDVIEDDLKDIRSRAEVARVFNKKITGVLTRVIFRARRKVNHAR